MLFLRKSNVITSYRLKKPNALKKNMKLNINKNASHIWGRVEFLKNIKKGGRQKEREREKI